MEENEGRKERWEKVMKEIRKQWRKDDEKDENKLKKWKMRGR